MLGGGRLHGGCGGDYRREDDVCGFHGLVGFGLFGDYGFGGSEGVCGTGFGGVVPPRSVGLGISVASLSGWPKAVRLAKRVTGPSTVARVVPRRSLR